MMETTSLRHILLRGPQLATGQPLWELSAAAPDAFLQDSQHLPEDDTHPLRALLIDAAGIDGQVGFRYPHLVSLHVIVGHGTGKYSTQFDDVEGAADIKAPKRAHPIGFAPLPFTYDWDKSAIRACKEWLSVNVSDFNRGVLTQTLPSRRRWTFDKPSDGPTLTTSAYFISGPVPGAEERPSKPAAAAFQHVLAEPCLELEQRWPREVSEEIAVPAFALVAGRIELAVADGAFPWLAAIQPKAQPASAKGKIRRYPLTLTPEGIELECEVGFPGIDTPLSGRFLLSVDGQHLLLTLQPDRLNSEQQKRWLQAWQSVLPGDDQEEALHGFRLSGDANQIPAFRYSLSANNLKSSDANAPGFEIISDTRDLPVQIPARHLRLELLSPASGQRLDGVVSCSGGYFVLAAPAALKSQAKRYFGSERLHRDFSTGLDTVNTLVLAWASARPENIDGEVVEPYLALKSNLDTAAPVLNVDLVASVDHPYAVSLDERRLADVLRRAYGLPPLAADEADSPRTPLPGFIPMSDGWLQLPFANLPPLNPALDSALLGSTTEAPNNALDGFLRFMAADDIPQVFSAFEPRPPSGMLIQQAPWSVTLEGGSGLRVALALRKDTVSPGRIPHRGHAVVDQPDLSTRGLLWLSSDRPDAFEAIPRLGAGPGAFIDIPLERREQEQTVVCVALNTLKLTSTLQGQQATVRREKLVLSIDFLAAGAAEGATPPPVYYWARHPHMPLAAQMPMTRVASAAVRPLESRDLLPFEMRHDGLPKNRVAELAWAGEQVFAELSGNWLYKLPTGWPLPPKLQTGDSAKPMEVRGVALVAFGVPGAELLPFQETWETKIWQSLRAALRFDLPVLDEAFALASLPPSADDAGASVAPVAQPVATALDWHALEQFWHEQERRLQLARVAHSYIGDYKLFGDCSGVSVGDLVGGLSWNAPTAGFDLTLEALPYGWMQLGDEKKLTGNTALLGLEKNFSVDSAKLAISTAPTDQYTVQVLGNSPSSFLQNGFLTDARGVGARLLDTNQGWWRALSDLKPVDPTVLNTNTVGSFSSPGMLEVKEHESDTDELLLFWFKDIPLNASGKFEGSAQIDTSAWLDGQLQRGGFEWRLLPPAKSSAAYSTGSNRIALGDLHIEPLRLSELQAQFANGAPTHPIPQSLTIVARLHIGPDGEDVDDGGNLLTLGFSASSAGGSLLLKTVTPYGQTPLRFSFLVDGQLVTLVASGVSLDDGKLNLKAPRLDFEFAGRWVRLRGATQTGMTFTWSGGQAQAGALAITQATLTLNQPDQAAKNSLCVAYQLAVAPGPADKGMTALRVKASVALEALTHSARLYLLDTDVEVYVTLARGAFCLNTRSDYTFTTALVKGFPQQGHIQFGLIANIAEFADNSAPLAAVHFCGSLSGMSDADVPRRGRLELNRVQIDGGGTAGNWHGELTLHGKVSGQSAIAWPQVTALESVDTTIPFPETAANGRRKLRIGTGAGHTHNVEWLLSGHRMSMYTADCINRADPQYGLWAATVIARHTLSRSTAPALSFTSVDSIVLGAMAAVIPQWPTGSDNGAAILERTTRSTFAARYKDGEIGMTWPGRGGLGSVLYGAQGKVFRQAIYGKGEQAGNIVVSGGFVGLIEPPASPSSGVAPLVRLPVLMGLSAGYLGDNSGQPLLMQNGTKVIDLDVAWPDSLAALPIGLTFSCAVAPASASERDLESALSISARPLHGDAGTRSRLAGALLVEQSFASDFPEQTLLLAAEQTPYFFASAAALSRMLESFPTLHEQPRVISVVSHAHYDPKEEHLQRRAGALTTSGNWNPLMNRVAVTVEQGELLLVAGNEVLVKPWPGLDFKIQGTDGFDALVATQAYAMHTRPRAALLRDCHGDYLAVTLPQSTLQPMTREDLPEQTFADAGRGYQLPVHTGLEMAGVEEGFSGALRDDKIGGSGIAALSRLVNLPALAAKEDNGFSSAKAVWLTQQRAPLYLPIQSNFACEPIPWLLPSAPRNRLPMKGVLDEHLKALGALGTTWQPLLPSQAMLAAISERPGILMARHVRLEVDAEQGGYPNGAFDPQFPRFGTPAQASTALARVERTPRPGPLAENKGEEGDRRPCASPLLPTLNHGAWVGPADSLGGSCQRGDAGKFDWTVTLVAAPQTSGTITSSWDGTLRLVAEIDEKLGENTTEPSSWMNELLQLVFGPMTEAATHLQASASLEINGHSLPFRSLHVVPLQGQKNEPPNVRRGYASVVLDMRDAAQANTLPGPAVPAISELLAGADATPSVELKLTLFPAGVLNDVQVPLGPFMLATDDTALPSAKANAPVQLRFNLWPQLRERGALALEPTSLLFIDPAYNAGLSAPPHQVSQRSPARLRVFAADRQRVNRQGAVTLMAYTEPPLLDGQGNKDERPLSLQLGLLPRSGVRRELYLASNANTQPAMLKLENVHQLSLGRLLERDGKPAVMAAGDLLELSASLPEGTPLRLILTLTDEPVAEPPPALYAALSRTPRKDGVGLSLPLYAQSPLPWRVDLIDAAAGFRAGLLRRSAKFMWTLARPADETETRGVHIVKSDRNGQIYLPSEQSIDSDFIAPRRII